ncbi:hypothetical protein PSCLAVI8L_130516 [Pseudoclavibacter sp. 8L]|nr:hypothetical protein PSCLAVI8L_130516 [Pseudoclavibacter sp. 8L]
MGARGEVSCLSGCCCCTGGSRSLAGLQLCSCTESRVCRGVGRRGSRWRPRCGRLRWRSPWSGVVALCGGLLSGGGCSVIEAQQAQNERQMNFKSFRVTFRLGVPMTPNWGLSDAHRSRHGSGVRPNRAARRKQEREAARAADGLVDRG